MDVGPMKLVVLLRCTPLCFLWNFLSFFYRTISIPLKYELYHTWDTCSTRVCAMMLLLSTCLRYWQA